MGAREGVGGTSHFDCTSKKKEKQLTFKYAEAQGHSTSLSAIENTVSSISTASCGKVAHLLQFFLFVFCFTLFLFLFFTMAASIRAEKINEADWEVAIEVKSLEYAK